MSKSKAKLTGTPKEIPFMHVIKFDWFRKLTLKERFMILFGYNFLVMVRIPTRHNPGSMQPIIVGDITHNTTPDQQMRERLENILADTATKV